MNDLSYTRRQWKVFAEDLHDAFVKYGFEVVEEPYIDYSLYGFRTTYIRRYLLHKPTFFYDRILTTIIHVVGLPFGHQSQKMVVLSGPRNINNEPISETLKLRIHIDEDGLSHVVHGDLQHTAKFEADKTQSNPFSVHMTEKFIINQSNQQPWASSINGVYSNTTKQFINDLASYVTHIIETISPGLIQLPTEMKLEILKKLSVESIIKMSQVNNEFRSIIFKHGESLWRHLCLRDFNIKVINRMLHRSWIELYRDSYIIHQVEICRKERALPGLPERPALPPVPYRLQIEWLPEVLGFPL